MPKIIDFITSNACLHQNIFLFTEIITVLLQKKQEKKQLIGMHLQKEENGIEDTLKKCNYGKLTKENQEIVYSVIKSLIALLEKMDINKNFVIQTVNPLIIESVKNLNYTADVWCIASENREFSLVNGAIVHNCDALRYMSEGLSLINAAQGSVENDYKALRNFWGG
jgi:hypothetical protein